MTTRDMPQLHRRRGSPLLRRGAHGSARQRSIATAGGPYVSLVNIATDVGGTAGHLHLPARLAYAQPRRRTGAPASCLGLPTTGAAMRCPDRGSPSWERFEPDGDAGARRPLCSPTIRRPGPISIFRISPSGGWSPTTIHAWRASAASKPSSAAEVFLSARTASSSDGRRPSERTCRCAAHADARTGGWKASRHEGARCGIATSLSTPVKSALELAGCAIAERQNDVNASN